MIRQLKINKEIRTERDEASILMYMAEIGKYKLLSVEEEVDLGKRIRETGDQNSVNILVNSNLRFVVSVAKQYLGNGLKLPDLIGFGNVGLIKAAWKFDETRGFKFISYAVWWIRQSIMEGLNESSRNIRLPLNKLNDLSAINKAEIKHIQVHNYPPATSELSEATGLSEDQILEIHRARKTGSLDFMVSEETPLIDLIADKNKDHVYYTDLKDDIRKLMNRLNDRERQIIKMSFGMGCTELQNEDIGKEFGITRERVRQIIDKSLFKMKRK